MRESQGLASPPPLSLLTWVGPGPTMWA